ncbi:hypothetical protein [uncultured Marinobacter sp.]|uniref:hypothetical protein n=1 Tax=uncultured Marinobacter sp. TaxID=187379 RepID=UPI0025D632E6|nr:hypothetical protein [uncultured Marinobacter sp.]
MAKAHKMSNQEAFLQRRTLPIRGLAENQWDDLLGDLNHHPCVDLAERKPTNALRIAYDASHWSVDDLLEMVTARGGQLKGGWWTQRKLAWYRFTDDNVRANAQHQPHCCSKMPPMKRK